MPVEKIDFAYISQEKKPFTTHLNSVLQNLKNPMALGIWAYLSSLPEGWKVNKEHLRKHFGLGRDKLDSIIKYLIENDLLEANQERLSDGKMGKGYIIVKVGYDFKQDCNAKEQSYPQKQPFTEKPLTAQPYTAEPCPGESAPINNINNINNIKRESTIRKKRESLSDFFPNEENQLLCKDLRLNINDEIESFKNRHRGKKTQYEFSRWLKSSKQYQSSKSENREIRSTVPLYGPGHPTWEALHGNKEKAHGSEISNNNSRGNSVRKAEGYLF
jgi:hypothetical protein